MKTNKHEVENTLDFTLKCFSLQNFFLDFFCLFSFTVIQNMFILKCFSGIYLNTL